MKANMKKALFILGGSAVALVLAAVIFVLTFNINSYKPRIEAAASGAIGMTVSINGNMKLTLFPGAGVLLENILIKNRDADVASIKKVEAGIKLLPLLWREVHIQQVGLINSTFFITKDRTGHFNVETPDILSGSFEAKKFFIRKGRLLYMDETSGIKTEVNDCDLAMNNFSAGEKAFPVSISFDGNLSCGEVKAEEFRISDVHVVIKARQGKFEAAPVTMTIFGGDGKGSIKGVMTGESPEYSVDFAVTKLRFEEVLGQFKQKRSTRGELDLNSHLVMKGKNADEITRTVQGEI